LESAGIVERNTGCHGVDEIIDPSTLGWIELTSKYANKCKVCNTEIEIGTKCLWKKGEGVKCLEGCVAELLEAEPPKKLISEKEWKDFQKYSWTQLQKITNCQCCGTPLSGDESWYSDDRRVCRKCF